MEFIKIHFLAAFICLLSTGLIAQNRVDEIKFVLGQWKYVNHHSWRATSYTIDQLNLLKYSRLIIEKHRVYYTNVDFIEPCSLVNWQLNEIDNTIPIDQLEVLYSKDEISKMVWINPVDKNGELACYNDCALFFLKQDTLINICGGWTLYLKREPLDKKVYVGAGSRQEVLLLKGQETSIEISYNFFKEPDRLVVRNQNGDILLTTESISTDGFLKSTLLLPEKTQSLTFELKGSVDNSKWQIGVKLF